MAAKKKESLDKLVNEALDKLLEWSPRGAEGRQAWWLRVRIGVLRGEWSPAEDAAWERNEAYEGDEDREPWFSLVDPWTGNGEDLVVVHHVKRGWWWQAMGRKTGVCRTVEAAKKAGVKALLVALSQPYVEDEV